jgi:hypothetical protein
MPDHTTVDLATATAALTIVVCGLAIVLLLVWFAVWAARRPEDMAARETSRRISDEAAEQLGRATWSAIDAQADWDDARTGKPAAASIRNHRRYDGVTR